LAICGIALGGNIGNTSEIFQEAMLLLEERSVSLRAVSALLHTPAMGAVAGDDFVNAAAVVETRLPPTELLATLHDVEAAFKRTRDIRWGPRSLDLDLLYHGQTVICTDQIVVPHPALWYRRFVLQPLTEIAPEFHHPILKEDVSELYQQLQQRPLRITISGAGLSDIVVSDLERSLQRRFGVDAIHLVPKDSKQNSDANRFTAVIVNAGTKRIGGLQPAHEADRTIRFYCQPDEFKKQLLNSLTDLCAAAIGYSSSC
jgi:2-amino-4-hydroxy-6-hydroxymethyldihydropteridine diphosphokinase